MNILDENIAENQFHILQSWRVPIRQIGHNIGRAGTKDEGLIPFLLELRRPTFFTRDIDFYKRKLCHSKYCLVYLDIAQYAVAPAVRYFLQHPQFNTAAKRMGAVVRLSPTELTVWRIHAGKESYLITETWT